MRLIRYATAAGPQQGWAVDGSVFGSGGDLFAPRPADRVAELANVELLAPVTPSKVVCVGRNYAAHIAEMGRPTPEWPFFFLKSPNAVVGPDEPIRRPNGVRRFDFEGELGLVIGRTAKAVLAENWRDYVAGFTCGNDMTVRDWQEIDGQWARAKSADTLCPLGPWVETELDDPENLAIRTYVNGELRQDGRTDDLVFGLGELVSFISAYLTLVPGDVILTGTPSGVANLDSGDVVEVEIEGVGRLRNPVEPAT